jgi:peptide/nickel transport system substrate-binding protein
VEWQKDEYITIRRNENYWGEMPSVEEVIWKVVPDASTRLLELQSGQVHAIKGIVPNQLETIENNEDLVMHRVAGANVFMAVFNAEAEPVNDPLVRQAIRHGVDLEALVESVYGGLGTVAATPMPPTVFGFADDLAPYEYDPQRARELLAEAGYPDGIAITINSFIAARPYVSKPLDAAQIMESQLSEAGIDVTIESNEWGTHSDIMDNDNHQIGLTGWYDVPYPSNFLKTMLLEGADTNWDHQQMQELALQALGTYERAEQERIYRQMQQITHQEVPVIPIAHSDYTAASRAEVEGLELDVVGTIKAHNVRY